MEQNSSVNYTSEIKLYDSNENIIALGCCNGL